MPLFRRRPPRDSTVEAFARVAELLDAAQRTLIAAVPTSRDPGMPLAEALAAFEAGLSDAKRFMPGWRTEATAALHDRCATALRAAREEAARLRLEPKALDFEALNARIGDVLHPLEEFADAERELRAR